MIEFVAPRIWKTYAGTKNGITTKLDILITILDNIPSDHTIGLSI